MGSVVRENGQKRKKPGVWGPGVVRGSSGGWAVGGRSLWPVTLRALRPAQLLNNTCPSILRIGLTRGQGRPKPKKEERNRKACCRAIQHLTQLQHLNQTPGKGHKEDELEDNMASQSSDWTSKSLKLKTFLDSQSVWLWIQKEEE